MRVHTYRRNLAGKQKKIILKAIERMKKLFLIRHAKSSWNDPDLSDLDRPLNRRGKENAPMMAKRMSLNWSPPEAVFCSPALRTRETAQFMAEHWCKDREVVVDERLYENSASSALDVLSEVSSQTDSVALVFHNPTITYLSNVLASLDIPNVPTCGIVILEMEREQWSEIEPASCRLRDFDYPKRKV